jgi:hypothetical protein
MTPSGTFLQKGKKITLAASLGRGQSIEFANIENESKPDSEPKRSAGCSLAMNKAHKHAQQQHALPLDITTKTQFRASRGNMDCISMN